jgi:hypothetical protein
MKYLLMLYVMELPTIFLMVGCGGGGSQGEHEDHARHSSGAKLELREYPLSQVKSDSEGEGSSTTTLRHTAIDRLFSGVPKYVNVHEAGSGNPPVLTCADLERVD